MKHRISRYRHRLKASNFNPQNKANSNWAGKTNGWAYSITSKRENAFFFLFFFSIINMEMWNLNFLRNLWESSLKANTLFFGKNGFKEKDLIISFYVRDFSLDSMYLYDLFFLSIFLFLKKKNFISLFKFEGSRIWLLVNQLSYNLLANLCNYYYCSSYTIQLNYTPLLILYSRKVFSWIKVTLL